MVFIDKYLILFTLKLFSIQLHKFFTKKKYFINFQPTYKLAAYFTRSSQYCKFIMRDFDLMMVIVKK